MQKLQDIQRAMELLSTCQGPAKNIDEATKHKYQFWDTQPVPKLSKFSFWSEELEWIDTFGFTDVFKKANDKSKYLYISSEVTS